MSETVIRVENLSKKYVIDHAGDKARYGSIRESLTNGVKGFVRRLFGRGPAVGGPTKEEFWALKGVSFEVKRGEVVGVIGRNGAGKSTLLKLLSQITKPTIGRIELDGRVASLLEVGTGFHPELTGRENVYLNGSILGMSRAEVRQKFDEIVAFAEVEKFLDTPVKRYSSGMYMRLAFAVAAYLEPEILIVDEVLAVGDSQFQKKCIDRIRKVRLDGRTVLLVSHNMGTVSELATSVLRLDRGVVAGYGETTEQVLSYLQPPTTESTNLLSNRTDRTGNGSIRFTSIDILHPSGDTALAVESGSAVDIVLHYESYSTIRQPVMLMAIFNEMGVPVSYFSSSYASLGTGVEDVSRSSHGKIVCSVPSLDLVPGAYTINICLTEGGVEADHVISALRFEITAGARYGDQAPPPASFGYYFCPHNWLCQPAEPAKQLPSVERVALLPC